MNFTESLKELKNGAHLIRENWTESDGYLVFMPGMTHVWKILTKPAPNAGNHIYSMEEICADDWCFMEEANYNS